MAASAFLNGSSIALGGASHTALAARLVAQSGKQVDTARLDAEATADGSVLATTTLLGAAETGGDGSGVLVVTYTSGIGAGEDAHSESVTRSFVISTTGPGPDIGFGMTRSKAWGEEIHDAVAAVELQGDITNIHSMEGDNALFSWAFSVGVTIDFA